VGGKADRARLRLAYWCPQEDLVITPPLHTEDFTQADVEEFHRLMTALLTTCRAIAHEHAPERAWTPNTDDLFGQSVQVIAAISRALNSAHGGIRRVGDRARQRFYERGAAGPNDSRPE
jgi:hypothetical protein